MTAEGNALYCWTVISTGKVKRIRNNPRVKLAKEAYNNKLPIMRNVD
jgi:general stress protein 26